MERMNEYQGNNKHANTSISSAHVGSTDGSGPRIGPGLGPRASIPCLGPPVIREQDQYMPIANVIRIMRRILPAHAKISDDAKETIQECVSEYISFVTGEANDRCQREQRKTVTAEDVLWAMSKLGFDDYVPPLTLFLNRYRATNNNHNNVIGPDGPNNNDDFVHFKRGGAGPMVDPYAGYNSFGPGAFGGMGMFDPMVGGPSEYYMSVGPSHPPPPSSSAMNNNVGLAGYDPFAQFK